MKKGLIHELPSQEKVEKITGEGAIRNGPKNTCLSFPCIVQLYSDKQHTFLDHTCFTQFIWLYWILMKIKNTIDIFWSNYSGLRTSHLA